MPRKSTKKTLKPVRPQLGEGVEILNAGSVLEDSITRTLETNYMPYAMSVIVSRALPEIDGFKPAHRKLLYTMYEMGLLKGGPHQVRQHRGPAPCTSTPTATPPSMTPWCAWAGATRACWCPLWTARATSARPTAGICPAPRPATPRPSLKMSAKSCSGTSTKKPWTSCPTTTAPPRSLPCCPSRSRPFWPTTRWASPSAWPATSARFNLAELCDTTIALMKDAKHDIATTMPAPDFVGGGQILYDEAQMREIYEKGRGSVRVRAKYNASARREHAWRSPRSRPPPRWKPSWTRSSELVKAGKLKEISDMRDETDLNGLKLTLDLKRGVDADKLMAKLFKATPLEDSFSCNFNILVSGQPRVMGVREILQEWTAFRMECVRRRTYYDLHGKEKRLHLLQGPCRASCWTSTRPSTSSAPRRRRLKWSPT